MSRSFFAAAVLTTSWAVAGPPLTTSHDFRRIPVSTHSWSALRQREPARAGHSPLAPVRSGNLRLIPALFAAFSFNATEAPASTPPPQNPEGGTVIYQPLLGFTPENSANKDVNGGYVGRGANGNVTLPGVLSVGTTSIDPFNGLRVGVPASNSIVSQFGWDTGNSLTMLIELRAQQTINPPGAQSDLGAGAIRFNDSVNTRSAEVGFYPYGFGTFFDGLVEFWAQNGVSVRCLNSGNGMLHVRNDQDSMDGVWLFGDGTIGSESGKLDLSLGTGGQNPTEIVRVEPGVVTMLNSVIKMNTGYPVAWSPSEYVYGDTTANQIVIGAAKGVVAPGGVLSNRGLQDLSTDLRPVCDSSTRGLLYVEKGTGPGGADQLLLCQQTNATGPVYGWTVH